MLASRFVIRTFGQGPVLKKLTTPHGRRGMPAYTPDVDLYRTKWMGAGPDYGKQVWGQSPVMEIEFGGRAQARWDNKLA